jgi:hypothetical protein
MTVMFVDKEMRHAVGRGVLRDYLVRTKGYAGRTKMLQKGLIYTSRKRLSVSRYQVFCR